MTSTNAYPISLIPPMIDAQALSKDVLTFTNKALVTVFVASENLLKIEATRQAVTKFVQKLFGDFDFEIQGYEVASEIDEQPHGYKNTLQGAENRLKNLKNRFEVKRNLANAHRINILVSLENGLMKEIIGQDMDANVFKNADQSVWIDRCLVVGEIECHGKVRKIFASSLGVPAPHECVELSEKTNWTKTAGFFMAEKYGWNAKDWHAQITGANRQTIMIEAISRAFESYFTPSIDPSLFHEYSIEDTTLFVSASSTKILNTELKFRQGLLVDTSDIEAADTMRDYYKSIPQLNKKGPDGKTDLYNSGVILTTDLLIGYFDEVMTSEGEKKDVLHIVLLWSNGKPKEGDAPGWVIPGKRDQAYDPERPDISLQESNLSLVEKELGIDRAEVAHHAVLGYFDDRLREPRFKSSGFLSFVLLYNKPPLEAGKRIGVPLNGIKLLAERQIAFSPSPGVIESSKMARNHDSLILAAMRTAKFCHTLEKVKLNQIRFRELLQSNAKAIRPSIPSIDPGQECPVCQELLVGIKVVCSRGHSLCGICLPRIQEANNRCPNCRDRIDQPIPNLALEHVIQYLNPVEYRKRYQEMHGKEISLSWEQDPIFCSDFIKT